MKYKAYVQLLLFNVNIVYAVNIVGYIVDKRILQEASSLDRRVNFRCEGCRLGC